MKHNGQRSATPFVRLATLAMHRLSFHVDGDPPVIADDVKATIGKLTPDQFKTIFPESFTKIGETAVTTFKGSLPGVPEKYELKLPDGSVLQPTVLEKITPAARALGIVSNENAQKLVDLVDGEAKALAERIASNYSPGGAVYESQRRQYEAAALAAPDLGNGSTETLQAKVARVTTFTTKYLPDDVRKLMNDTGIGNHPGFFRAMLKLADLMKEDGFVPGAGTKPVKSHADRIYSGETK